MCERIQQKNLDYDCLIIKERNFWQKKFGDHPDMTVAEREEHKHGIYPVFLKMKYQT